MHRKFIDAASARVLSNPKYGVSRSEIESIQHKLNNGIELSADELRKYRTFDSEVGATMSEYYLGNEDFIHRLIIEDAPLAERVIDKLAALRASLARLPNAEARAEYKHLRRAEKLYLKATRAAGNMRLYNKLLASINEDEIKEENNANEHISENMNVSEGEIKYSRMNDLSFSENVKRIVQMSDEEALRAKQEENYILVMKNTPNVLLKNVNDAENLKVIIRFDSLYLATRATGILDGNYHNLGAEIASKLPTILSNPDCIIKLKNGRYNILSTINGPKGKTGVISIELNTVKDINTKYQKYNMIISAFSAADNYIRNLINKQAEEIIYKKEDLPQVNPQLHTSLSIINEKPSENSISDSREKVNTDTKYSYKIPAKSRRRVKYINAQQSGKSSRFTRNAMPRR